MGEDGRGNVGNEHRGAHKNISPSWGVILKEELLTPVKRLSKVAWLRNQGGGGKIRIVREMSNMMPGQKRLVLQRRTGANGSDGQGNRWEQSQGNSAKSER